MPRLNLSFLSVVLEGRQSTRDLIADTRVIGRISIRLEFHDGQLSPKPKRDVLTARRHYHRYERTSRCFHGQAVEHTLGLLRGHDLSLGSSPLNLPQRRKRTQCGTPTYVKSKPPGPNHAQATPWGKHARQQVVAAPNAATRKFVDVKRRVLQSFLSHDCGGVPLDMRLVIRLNPDVPRGMLWAWVPRDR